MIARHGAVDRPAVSSIAETPQPRRASSRPRGRRVAHVIALLAGSSMVATGLWAFVAPDVFFERIASFEPFNAHFIRDLASFQIGLGAVLILATRWNDALLVGLGAAAIGSAWHLVSHVIDYGDGSGASDLVMFTLTPLILVTGVVAGSRQRHLS